MDDDIETRILHRFEFRLEETSDVSPKTRRVLLESDRDSDFGDDADLLERLVERSDQ